MKPIIISRGSARDLLCFYIDEERPTFYGIYNISMEKGDDAIASVALSVMFCLINSVSDLI
nr:MAG TPA: hypothetical protein [Caudoviricetes sp.]